MNAGGDFPASRRIRAEILGRDAPVNFTGAGELPSTFAVSDLAAASVAAAGIAVAEYLAAFDGETRAVTVDRRLASFWFQASLFPQGWNLPPIWDAVAGDYQAADGWIRLHTNAPYHRRAALGVLGVSTCWWQRVKQLQRDNQELTRRLIGPEGDKPGAQIEASGGDGAEAMSTGRAILVNDIRVFVVRAAIGGADEVSGGGGGVGLRVLRIQKNELGGD